MTRSKRPRLPFKALPANWGKKRAAHYDLLACTYRESDDEDVESVLRAIACLIEGAPRCTRADIRRCYAALKSWNKTRADQNALVCPRCGEYRLSKMQMESGHVRVFRVHAIVATPYGPTPLMRPHEEPVSAGAIFRCMSCDRSWAREEQARLAFFPQDVPGGVEAAAAAGGTLVPIADPKDIN